MTDRIRRFEDLVAWQKAFELHERLQQEMRKPSFRRAWSLKDQIERATTSTMGNIAEGYERTGGKEFAHGLSIAKGSNAEVRSHLYAARSCGYLEPDAFESLQSLADEISRIIAGLRVAVLNGKFR